MSILKSKTLSKIVLTKHFCSLSRAMLVMWMKHSQDSWKGSFQIHNITCIITIILPVPKQYSEISISQMLHVQYFLILYNVVAPLFGIAIENTQYVPHYYSDYLVLFPPRAAGHQRLPFRGQVTLIVYRCVRTLKKPLGRLDRCYLRRLWS